MHIIKNRTVSSSFLEKFEQLSHSYLTHFSSGNYRKPQTKVYECTFLISIRVPSIWKDLVGSTKKVIKPSSFVKTKMKNKLFNLENGVIFFNTFAFKNSLAEAWLMVKMYYNYST